ncbi:hypothetical protein GCM10029976_066740 [Kribbella albertanoniae]
MAASPEFTALVAAARAAISQVLGSDAVRPEGAGQRPHASLGYGLTNADSDPLIGDLNALDPAAVTFSVDQVHLLAVDQDLTAGIYTWRPLATIALATT